MLICAVVDIKNFCLFTVHLFFLKLHHFQTASSVLPVKMQEIITTAIDGQKTNGVRKVSALSLGEPFGVTPHLGVS